MIGLWLRRRRVMSAGLALAIACSGEGAQSQSAFPSAPVRIVVPLATGGAADALARAVADALAVRWSQQVLVDNRPGADGVLAATYVLSAKPDGHTLLLGLATLPITPLLQRRATYDVARDFAPVSLIATTPVLLVSSPGFATSDVAKLASACQAHSGACTFGTSDSLNRLGFELLNLEGRLSAVRVPYKGGSQLATDLIGGHLALGFLTPNTALPHIRAGRLMALAVAGPNRIAALADTPTLAERGLPGFDQDPWYGLLAPRGTPADVVSRIQGELQQVLASSAVRERLTQLGMTPAASTSREFAAVLEREASKWARVISQARVELEE